MSECNTARVLMMVPSNDYRLEAREKNSEKSSGCVPLPKLKSLKKNAKKFFTKIINLPRTRHGVKLATAETDTLSVAFRNFLEGDTALEMAQATQQKIEELQTNLRVDRSEFCKLHTELKSLLSEAISTLQIASDNYTALAAMSKRKDIKFMYMNNAALCLEKSLEPLVEYAAVVVTMAKNGIYEPGRYANGQFERAKLEAKSCHDKAKEAAEKSGNLDLLKKIKAATESKASKVIVPRAEVSVSPQSNLIDNHFIEDLLASVNNFDSSPSNRA